MRLRTAPLWEHCPPISRLRHAIFFNRKVRFHNIDVYIRTIRSPDFFYLVNQSVLVGGMSDRIPPLLHEKCFCAIAESAEIPLRLGQKSSENTLIAAKSYISLISDAELSLFRTRTADPRARATTRQLLEIEHVICSTRPVKLSITVFARYGVCGFRDGQIRVFRGHVDAAAFACISSSSAYLRHVYRGH